MEIKNTDVLIVGTGASGLFAALHIPQDLRVLMITISCPGRDLHAER